MEKHNYISYSLWGDKPVYILGILKNIEQAKEIYKGWKVIVYHDDTVPSSIIEEILRKDAQVVDMSGKSYGMFWRFLAADLPDCHYAIFRDSDSRLSIRESLAVEEWIKSGKSIHIMRDHPNHKIPYGSDRLSILGGMWGIKGGLIPMEKMIDIFSEKRNLGYGIDQTFLMEIQTMFEHDAVVHDEFFSNAPFPIKRINYRFIGERIDENDQPIGKDWEVLKNYYTQKTIKGRLYILLYRVYRKLLKRS